MFTCTIEFEDNKIDTIRASGNTLIEAKAAACTQCQDKCANIDVHATMTICYNDAYIDSDEFDLASGVIVL